MNTYLVPVTKEYQSIFTDIMVIYANNERDAYSKAKIKKGLIPITIMNYHDIPYDFFIGEINFSESFFSVSRKYDIIKQALSLSTEGSCMEIIDIYNYMYWGDYNLQIQKLADKALQEKWSFENKNDNYILKNYLKYTFNKLQEENKIIETDTYCAFDTGLFSEYYAPIYAYGESYKNPSENTAKWFFKGFKDKYELGALDIIEKFPERADYFSDPSKLVFNWHLDVNINYKHILDDLRTLERLPESIKNSDMQMETLEGAINNAVKRLIVNYKLAVPHYYCNKIQLMIPLYFGKSNKPDVALVLDRMKGNYYQATTCLSMDMAYMDARIIAKPESNWLMVENITE